VNDMSQSHDPPSVVPVGDVGDELDELLGDAVVFESGTPVPSVPVSRPLGELKPERPPQSVPRREPKVSVLFWAAAIVWSLLGGVGGWLILRQTHPKTARTVLIVGIVSFAVLAVVFVALMQWQRALYQSHVYLK
jgi:hypothetical protein